MRILQDVQACYSDRHAAEWLRAETISAVCKCERCRSATYDCAALNQEIAKSQSVKQQIDKTGEFDALTILGFVGDFGIGNGIAKASANNKAAARLQQLENLKAMRCEHNAT